MGADTIPKPLAALVCGYLSTFCFFCQYIPQTILNFKRKSVSGFSTTGIIIKLAGASFLLMNSILVNEAFPTTLYGLCNVIQHSVFMLQFSWYTGETSFLYWIAFPAIPYLLGSYAPYTIGTIIMWVNFSSRLTALIFRVTIAAYTSLAKPLSQFFSHLPQLYVTYKKKSTEGVSLASQHLNFVGGILGMYSTYRLFAWFVIV